MIRSIVLAAWISGLAFGQTAFEVASVKPSQTTGGRSPIGLFTYPGGRIVATNYTLKMLLHDAYDLEMYRILGGPQWADGARYDIEAKAPASSESSKWVPASFKSPPNPEMRRMLQTLLADRFQLKTHMESKKESVYALVVDKGGPKLQEPTTSKDPFIKFSENGLVGQNATMTQLVERLSGLLRRPVLDQTGITGHFDFQIEYDAQSDTAPTLFRALQEQLKLKLETRPGSIEVLVIDRAEKPSGN